MYKINFHFNVYCLALNEVLSINFKMFVCHETFFLNTFMLFMVINRILQVSYILY